MEHNPPGTNLFGLSIDATGKNHLLDAAKWARFLSIVGFIFITLFALLLIFFGAFFFQNFLQQDPNFSDPEIGAPAARTAAVAMIAYYVIIFILVFLAYLFLYRFASNMRKALATNDQDSLNRSFMYLKVLYRYWGILTIIGLAFFCLGVIVVLLSNPGIM